MAAGNSLFISYGHRDMAPTDWLERLKLYLAPLRRQEVVDIWDDSRIRVGANWRQEIDQALTDASAAILLVGPAFLASEFISSQELPALLEAAKKRGLKIYPVIVGYCAYQASVLEPYQAFNDPEKPLESLSAAEQNKVLNGVSLLVDRDMRQRQTIGASAAPKPEDVRNAIQAIRNCLDDTETAFMAQTRRRDQLVQMICTRLGLQETLEYENLFFRYYGSLNAEERFQFDQIRAITEGPLYEGNRQILEMIEKQPAVLTQVPELLPLRQHLVFWLNKYERVFSRKPEMCVLYTGVEDGVPFPRGIELALDLWLAAHE